MAMTICKECEEEVSSKAKTCPNCGINKPGKKGSDTAIESYNSAIGCCILIIFIVLGISMCSSDDDIPTTDISSSSQPDQAGDGRDRSSMAFIQCKNYVTDNLKSPSTADFPFMDRKTWNFGNDTYVIKSYVDAQNAFGATIRNSWHCKIRYKGGEVAYQRNWDLLELEILPPL